MNPLNAKVDAHGVRMRESRDSADNPRSTPIIVGIDVTGSMQIIADYLAREGLGTLFQEILDRKPVSDPSLCFMAIGDANYDRAPLQVSQFESDARIIEQLTQIWIEHGGGGNGSESYHLPWYFAANHTAIDSLDKRGEKGFLFTVGDEETPPPLMPHQIKRFIGDEVEKEVSAEEALAMAQRMYHVFHVVVEEGSHARGNPDGVMSAWTKLLGERVLRLQDHTKMSEVIVSAIQIVAGDNPADVAASWSGDTSLVVARAVGALKVGGKATAPVRL